MKMEFGNSSKVGATLEHIAHLVLPQRRGFWGLYWKICKGQIWAGGNDIGVFHDTVPLMLHLLESYASILRTTMLNSSHWTGTVSCQMQRYEFDSALDWNT